MLTSQSIRFATDTFGTALTFDDEPTGTDDPAPAASTFLKQAFLVAKKPLDCSKKASVDQFVITGNEPQGSQRRIIFRIDNNLFYFKNGSLVSYTRAGKFDDVINYGNKVSTLTNLSNITDFVGKKINPIIALQCPADADDFPTIKIALATRTNDDQLTYSVDSPIYELAKTSQTISSIEAQTNLVGNGSVEITVRLRDQGSWSSYMTLAQAADESADAVQFHFKYTVANADGSDSAQVQSIIISHSSGQSVVTGDKANLFSIVQDYGADLKTAYIVVRHDKLIDSTLEGYVNFMHPTKHKDPFLLGTANGSRQEFTLTDSNIVPSSIKVFRNSQPFYDFDFNTATKSIILTAAKNSAMYASYDYDSGQEHWLKMTAQDPQPYDDDGDTYSTRFTYTLDDPTDMKVANVRIRIIRNSGSAQQNLGTANGRTQLFTLAHRAKSSTITFTKSVDFSYDEDANILSCVAAKNTALSVSYNWQGVPVVIHSFAAGFSAT